MSDDDLKQVQKSLDGAREEHVRYGKTTFHVGKMAMMQQLIDEVRRLKWRLNHQTDDDVEACRQGRHTDCGVKK